MPAWAWWLGQEDFELLIAGLEFQESPGFADLSVLKSSNPVQLFCQGARRLFFVRERIGLNIAMLGFRTSNSTTHPRNCGLYVTSKLTATIAIIVNYAHDIFHNNRNSNDQQ